MTISNLARKDKELAGYIEQELLRQQETVELIASENIVSKAVLEAGGSILTNKYAEGYSGNRYYGGCQYVDKIENLAISRVKELFGANYANVQPHSGSQANFAVFLALLKPGDTILAMSLNSGGHLTHGASISFSGKWFNVVTYDVNKDTGLLDYSSIEKLAKMHKPKMIIAGGSSYSRIIDFNKVKEIADEVEAYLMIDMAHFSGLVASSLYPNPLPYADVVTSTTHKTLRGPRGGIILTNKSDIAKKINSAVFPGSQGGPLMHIIAAKAVAFKEALSDDFKQYSAKVIENAKLMSDIFISAGLNVVSGGTDSHLLLVDLTSLNITGKQAEALLDEVNITCNKNSIPFDTLSPKHTSGLRFGTPAITSRGMGVDQIKSITNQIIIMLKALQKNQINSQLKLEVKNEIKSICNKFPIYTFD